MRTRKKLVVARNEVTKQSPSTIFFRGLLRGRSQRQNVLPINHYKSYKFLKYFFLSFLFVIFITACGSDYTARTSSALRSFERGDFDSALKGIESQSKKKLDRLLFLIDKGVVLHTAGKYKESIVVLQEAEDYSESIDYLSVSNELVSLFTNERMRAYKGEAYERVLINVFKAIDYIMLGDIENALVECRRINEKLEKFNKILKLSQMDPFPRYISGVLFEANNDINDAYIDYKLMHKIDPNFYYLASDLLSLSKKLGFLDDFSEWEKVFGVGGEALRPSGKDMGELVFVYECGLSPKKESTEMNSQAQILPIPVYRDRPSQISHAEIYINSELQSRTYLLSDIGKLSKIYLDKRIAAYVARGIARLAIKEGTAVAVGKYVNKDLGILVGIAMLFTNRADLRSAMTLPENIQIARVFLKEGVSDIEVRFVGKQGGYIPPSKIFSQVEINRGKKTFLNFRTFR